MDVGRYLTSGSSKTGRPGCVAPRDGEGYRTRPDLVSGVGPS